MTKEQRIAVLVGDYFDGQRTVQSAVTAAWREATEAAAKKCEAVEAPGDEHHRGAQMYMRGLCAAAIRNEL